MKKINSKEEFTRLKEELKGFQDQNKKIISVCKGTGCSAFGSGTLIKTFEKEIEKRGLSDQISVKKTGCHGFCEKGPIVVILPDDIFYHQVSGEDVPDIIERTIQKGEFIDKLLYKDPKTKQKYIYTHDVPFYAKQKRVVFHHNGLIDPTNIEDYLGVGGYDAFIKALFTMTPEQVIDEVKSSGLRGRGGGGFLTGLKWEFCSKAKGDPKYLICNADEGDPGAFMDRSLLEGNPHLVLEGMLIAGYAIGSSHGYVYVRAEYPLAIANLKIAIAQGRELGILGQNILGTDFSFDLQIKEGAGAFVCGEETALMASIEGKRGMPRPRPPFPAHKGLWGKPSNINNVETFANVSFIIGKGAQWYADVGTEKSKGTKIFALAGKVNNTGLVEVPMGITLREVVFGIGGGPPKGRKFKAVQLGGPSGGCIPEDKLDTPIDYDSLVSLGAIMGSGGMVVMDTANCMVDVARFFLEFIQNESCGKCVPCRIGTKRMLEIVTRITEGEGKESDLALLKELAEGIKATALCGLGQTAPNPVLSTIRYFLDEYHAHILEKRCPAHVCTALIKFEVDQDLCKKCGICKKVCPPGAIIWEPKTVAAINKDLCIQCRTCIENCPAQAIG
jgi:NADH:ubiquinone oxidoreductase subunit F (NADH-binding)/(2Fe-2S) ferredoxin/Pyruvate/2-oxoacid:ferredoxin oxidoreductase delta subunit